MQNRKNNYTPDILDCLANLSSDEVFTPPEIVNRVLDMLPQEVFQSTETTFLDPCTKSGVFLREITKRLLKAQIPMYEDVTSDIRRRCMGAIQSAVNDGRLDRNDPDFTEKAKAIGDTAKNEQDIRFERHLQEVLNHILTKQVFGIAITELTAELSRRSLYCSKNACGQYSICSAFTDSAGNIRFIPMAHTWVKPNGQPVDEHDLNDSETAKKNWHCKYCGTSYGSLGQDRDGLESHAYEFIHTDEPERIWGNMEFTVICGNPPYSLADGGGTGDSAQPIYNKFIEQAERLRPKFLTMIIPSRWMKGGKGLDKFRQKMMSDTHISQIFDYENAEDCFSGVHIDGGVCYFLRDESFSGPCHFVHQCANGYIDQSTRLLKTDIATTVIRDSRQVSIISKTKSKNTFSMIVSSRNPYGLYADFFNHPKRYPEISCSKHSDSTHDVKVYGVSGIKGGAQRTYGFVSHKDIPKNNESVAGYKLFFSKAYMTTATVPPEIICGEPNEISTETFLEIGPWKSAIERDNALSYIKTKFFRSLLFFNRHSLNISKESFELIPMQDFSHPWTDEMLYKKYGLTQDEIDFIEKMIKPME